MTDDTAGDLATAYLARAEQHRYVASLRRRRGQLQEIVAAASGMAPLQRLGAAVAARYGLDLLEHELADAECELATRKAHLDAAIERHQQARYRSR